MAEAPIGTRDEWLARRVELLDREKELNRLRDELAAARRELPWVPVEKTHSFETSDGTRTLRDLFGDRTQLAIYHFMYGPDWDEGCPSCSFWADSYDGTQAHLAARDTAFACVSRAPLDRLLAYRERMGWSFDWHSSLDSEFNFDFGVSFTPEQQAGAATHNFRDVEHPPEELPGLSVFARRGDDVFHTYSTYSRGLDPLNTAYQLLDLTPMGRDEDDLEWSMAWLRRHDQYGLT